jgi:hypothetical protein
MSAEPGGHNSIPALGWSGAYAFRAHGTIEEALAEVMFVIDAVMSAPALRRR